MKTLRQILESLPERPVHRALKLADRLYKRRPKNTDRLDQMKPPIPQEHIYTNHISMADFHKHAKIEKVPIHKAKLKTRQFSVGINPLKAKIDGSFDRVYGKENPPGQALFVHHGGAYHVLDGNHRVAAARLLRKSHIEGKVLHLTDNGDIDPHKHAATNPPKSGLLSRMSRPINRRLERYVWNKIHKGNVKET